MKKIEKTKNYFKKRLKDHLPVMFTNNLKIQEFTNKDIPDHPGATVSKYQSSEYWLMGYRKPISKCIEIKTNP